MNPKGGCSGVYSAYHLRSADEARKVYNALGRCKITHLSPMSGMENYMEFFKKEKGLPPKEPRGYFLWENGKIDLYVYEDSAVNLCLCGLIAAIRGGRL